MPTHTRFQSPALAPALALALALAGCATPVEAPTAVVAAPASVAVGVWSVLDGSGSSDPNTPALPLAFAWRITSRPAGSVATLNDASLARPSLRPDVAGEYEVRLTVSNGVLTGSSDAKFSAGPCGDQPPTFVADSVRAEPAAPAAGQRVTLQAASVDADNEATCGLPTPQTTTVTWALLRRPDGSAAVLLDAASSRPGFVTDAPGEYELRATVEDSTGRRSSAPLVVTASVCGANPPVVTEIEASPAAPAVASPVQLTARIEDADESEACSPAAAPGEVTYAWSLRAHPPASTATLSNASAVNPSLVPDVAGAYVVRLVATDATGRRSAARDFTFEAATCAPTLAEVTATPETPKVGDEVVVTVAATSSCPANDAAATRFDRTWSLLSAPGGSRATAAARPDGTGALVPDREGDYLLGVFVTDGAGRTTAATHAVTVTGFACGQNTPAVAAVTAAPENPAVGARVRLAATVTDADEADGCSPGQTFQFAWRVETAPTGSAARLNDPALEQPTLFVDEPGDYRVVVIATDASGRPSAPGTLVVTAGTCGTNAPAATPEANGATSDETAVTAAVGVAVTLDAKSTDADLTCGAPGGESLTHAWSVVAAPAGSAAAVFAPAAARTSFVPDVTGRYELEILVTDRSGRTARRTVAVLAGPCGAQAPAVAAKANGADSSAAPVSVAVGVAVRLESAPTDADLEAACAALGVTERLTVAWSIMSAPSGSRSTVLNPTSLTPSIVPDVRGGYVLAVDVTDATGRRGRARVTLTAGPCGVQPPTATVTANDATSGSDPVPVAFRTGVVLEATATDPDTGGACAAFGIVQPLTYAWSLAAQPPTSVVRVTGTGPRVSFVPDAPGFYTARVRVTDPTGLATLADVDLEVDTCGTNAPTITALSAGAAPAAGVATQLSATASDPDNATGCALGQVLTHAWTLTSAPAGSVAVLTSRNQPSIVFTPDLAGDYTVSVVVGDGTGRSTTRALAFTVAPCSPVVARIAALSPLPSSASTSLGPISVFRDDSVQFDGSASTASSCAPANTALTYEWRAISLPEGGATNGALNSTTVVNPTAGPLGATGAYAYELKVSDGITSSTATARLRVQGAVPGALVDSGNAGISVASDPVTGRSAVAYLDWQVRSVKVALCTAGCDTASATWTIETLATNIGVLTAGPVQQRPVSLAYTSAGTLVAAYYLPGRCTFAFGWRSSTGVWTTREVVASPGFTCGTDGLGSGSSFGRDLSMALRADDLPGFAFLVHDGISGKDHLQYVECSDLATKCLTAAPTFTTRQTVDAGNDLRGYQPSLRYASNNGPRVASYHRDDTNLHYSACDAGCTTAAWAAGATVHADENRLAGDVGRMPSLALTAGDQPRIAYTNQSDGRLSFAQCTSNCLTPGSWLRETVDGNQGDYASLALDGSGRPHIAYTDQPNGGGSLKVAQRQGNAWSLFRIDNTGSYFYTSLSIGASGALRIAYGDGSIANRANGLYYTAVGL